MYITITTVFILSSIGAVAAIILFFVAKKFKVYEDERIALVEEALPGANCGGCGFPGCKGFSEILVKSEDWTGLNCPVGGGETMSKVSSILGKEAVSGPKIIAVLRCSGSCDHRPSLNNYDGASSCTIASNLYGGETGCSFGCLGLGDCVVSCEFDALHINTKTGLPEIDEEKCVACGSCVKACPKLLIELRKKGPKSRRIFVSCMNKDKGAIAKKNCSVACIGCSKCFKECPHDAISVQNNLAFISDDKCKLCRKCVSVCPTKAIQELNFPPARVKEVKGELSEELQN